MIDGEGEAGEKVPCAHAGHHHRRAGREGVVDTEIGGKLEHKVTWGLKATMSSSDFDCESHRRGWMVASLERQGLPLEGLWLMCQGEARKRYRWEQGDQVGPRCQGR